VTADNNHYVRPVTCVTNLPDYQNGVCRECGSPAGQGSYVKRYDCGGPENCIDDLCASSDRGLCGRWRLDLDDWGEEHDDWNDEE
jgi:hypothetical protein